MIKLYGKNCVVEAIRANAPLKEVYILNEYRNKSGYLEDALRKNNVKLKYETREFLNKSFGNHNQGYGAIRENYPSYTMDYIINKEKSFKRVLILDGVADPQNFGAIIRSADAFSFDAIILGNNRSVPITEVVCHVSTGAIEYVPIIYVNSLNNAVKILKDNDFWIIATDASGDTLMEDISKDRNLALIIGSEGFGMTKTLVKASDYICKIPMSGHVNSLNASVSAGILLEKLHLREGE